MKFIEGTKIRGYHENEIYYVDKVTKHFVWLSTNPIAKPIKSKIRLVGNIEVTSRIGRTINSANIID